MNKRYPGKFLIGLTGNIAVGKSVVRQFLVKLGASAVDADRVAHQVIMSDGPTFKAVVEEFGAGIVGADGEIDRAALGKIVFADQARLRALEAITHPAIRARIGGLIRDAERRVVVIEAIKLLEGDLRHVVDTIWVVNASLETQLRRLITARGFSEELARQRIASQNKQEDKLRHADVVIENDGDIEETRAQVQRHWSEIASKRL